MKKEYDFSKGERGRFYRHGTTVNLPVYLDKENYAFVDEVARRKRLDVSTVVNQLIRSQAPSGTGAGT